MRGPILETREVGKAYPGNDAALDGVSLAVREGETLALVGESGSGKTTLLRLWNRMLEPTRGEVLVRGQSATAWDPIRLRRGIGYVEQGGGLLPHWTVEENVGLVPRILGRAETDRKSRARALLEWLGLDPSRFGGRYPLELSGGERQRVALARALAADPDVVLLDEPFGALDAVTRVDLHDEFLRWKQDLRKTLVLVTHDIAEAFRLADRIAVMRAGRLLVLDEPQALLRNASDPYVRRLLDHRTGASA